MPTAERVLDALGDPTRRRVLELVRDGPIAVGEIAEQLPVSRPAVSKHLRVLGESGLVTHVRVGHAQPLPDRCAGLTALRDYLDETGPTCSSAFAEHVAADMRRLRRGARPPCGPSRPARPPAVDGTAGPWRPPAFRILASGAVMTAPVIPPIVKELVVGRRSGHRVPHVHRAGPQLVAAGDPLGRRRDARGLRLDRQGFVETLADGSECTWGSVLAGIRPAAWS